MIKIILFLMMAVLLSACASSGGSPATSVVSQRVVVTPLVMAECRMLERAFVLTQKQAGQTKLGIVEGCPGRENVKISTNRFAEAGLFMSAAGARLPAHVKSGGVAAKRIFQRMISRGVPVRVAQKISHSPEFKVAVNVANQS